MLTDRPLWPGTSGPAVGSPVRVPGSVRRTSAVDITFPTGPTHLVLRGTARDLYTGPGGEPRVLAEAESAVSVDLVGRVVTALDVIPVEWTSRLQALVGTPTGSRFRSAFDEAAPELVATGSLLGLLLDEVPVTTLISGSSLSRRGLIPPSAHTRRLALIDVCAGWMADGAMVRAIEHGSTPLLGEGPLVPSLDDDDPLAWHAMADLAPGSMRRRRRLDLRPGSPHVIDVLFRDSYVEPDGRESGVHEYGILATVDEAGTILTITADPHVLPGPECPLAADSAQRLVGMPLAEVRSHVRTEFKGTSTCTHLNDALRSLGDLATLLPYVGVAS